MGAAVEQVDRRSRMEQDWDMIEVMIFGALLAVQKAIDIGPTWQIDLADVAILVGLGLIAGVIIGALITDTLRQRYRSK
jgi:hypothetical protein